MAISGGMTTAYNVLLWNGQLKVSQTTYPSDMCMKPENAVVEVMRGQQVTIKGSDMVKFNDLWEGRSVATS